jgi:hypothetical protein
MGYSCPFSLSFSYVVQSLLCALNISYVLSIAIHFGMILLSHAVKGKEKGKGKAKANAKSADQDPLEHEGAIHIYSMHR